MMSRRQMMMMLSAEGGLPAEYLQVEYLESTGTQKIDTGISGSCEIGFSAKSREIGSGTQIVVGRDYSGGTYVGKTSVWTLGGGVNFSTGVTEWVDVNAVFSSSSLSCTIGEETKTRNGSASYALNYFLFATGANSNYNASVMIKNCTIYQNGAKVRDFVPCIRIADSKPGMYDLVGRQFYTNAGTGEFLTGYVADGLVFHLDGIDRGGVSGKWKDLVGGITATLNGTYTENTDHIYFPATSPEGYGIFDTSLQIDKDVGTIDIAVELTAYEGTGRPTVSFKDDCIGGSISSLITGYGGALRWYLHSGNMKCWRFPESAKSLVITASGNSDRGMCNGYDGTLIDTTSWQKSSTSSMIAFRGSGNYFKGKMYAVRIYNRKLSAAEMLHNQRVDNTRFNLGLTI